MFIVVENFNNLFSVSNLDRKVVAFVEKERSFYYLVNWSRRQFTDGWNKLQFNSLTEDLLYQISNCVKHINLTGNVHGLTGSDIQNLLLTSDVYRQVNPSSNIVAINATNGTKIYTEASANFTINWTNVRNGIVGIHTLVLSNTVNITLVTVYDENNNSYTKRSFGIFTSLTSGTYNIAWAAVNLGNGKRIFSINIQKYT